MTRPEARRVALYVSAAWPGTKLSETSIELWADAIQDLPADVAQEAARAMVREVAKFPSVAALRERADRILRQPAPYQPALTYRPAPSTVEERRSSPGLKALGDVAAQLRKRVARGT